jgi:hypothetical protein
MNTPETQSWHSVQRMVRLCNAITEAIREMEKCPDDSVQDIWNESLESWQTGLRMDHDHNVEPNVQAQGRPAE